MAKRKIQSEDKQAAVEDIGAAMMAWYAEAIQEYPEGLVTQAQAAVMLGISRMAVSRLVSRGYLRAVYFPKPPDIVGVAVGHDDPTWLKITAWLGDWDKTYAFPKAAYVSFRDVIELWKSGEAKKRCRRDWNEIMATFLSPEKRYERMRELHDEQATLARHKREECKKTEQGRG